MATTDKLRPLVDGAQFENHSEKAVCVSALTPNFKAAYSGLRVGGIMVSANRQRVFDIKS